MPTNLIRFILTTALSLAISVATHAADAPLGSADFHPSVEHPFGWRGDGGGCFSGATPVAEFSATKNVRWHVVVGQGYSSPILTDQLVIVSAEPNVLIGLNRADGKVRWKLEVTPADIVDPKARKSAEDYKAPKDGSGLAAATPLTDGATIYAVFANGIVKAVDLEGKPKWCTAIDAVQNTAYGRSASPVLAGGKLIVHMTNLYAYDPSSGKQLWMNAKAKSSYGTPAAVKVGTTDVIVTALGDVVRLADGESLGSDIAHTAHSSPIAAGNALVCFGDNPASMLRFDGAFKEEELWNADLTGEVFGSPVLHDNTLYLATGGGDLFAFDANAKGSATPIIDNRRVLEAGGGAAPAAYASLTLAGKYLFLNSNSGEIVVLEATREAKLVSRNKLPKGTGSSPVFSGREMFLRDGDALYCIGAP